jgi:nitroreductase
MDKPAQTSQPIHPLLANRWSPCALDSDRPVPAEARLAMQEAARWAPSCYGEQPWSFVLCDRSVHPDSWRKVFDCLAEGNQEWAKNAPLLILALSSPLFDRNGRENRHFAYDCGAAVLAMVLEAERQGLRGHQIGGFDASAVRDAFQIPEPWVCLAVVAIGYPAAAAAVSEKLQERDKAPRKRKPLTENFFHGEWKRAPL